MEVVDGRQTHARSRARFSFKFKVAYGCSSASVKTSYAPTRRFVINSGNDRQRMWNRTFNNGVAIERVGDVALTVQFTHPLRKRGGRRNKREKWLGDRRTRLAPLMPP